MTPEQIFARIYQAKIRHVFGRLPALGGEQKFVPNNVGSAVLSYGQKLADPHEQAIFDRHSLNLRTIHEAEQEISGELQDMIGSSDKVVFLGCAYHEANIKREILESCG